MTAFQVTVLGSQTDDILKEYAAFCVSAAKLSV